MCYNAAMKAALALLLLVSPAYACDWVVTKKVNPMTDATMCMVTTKDGGFAMYRMGTDPAKVAHGSRYSTAGTYVRVDDLPAIYISRRDDASKLLEQLKTGKRLRYQYRSYPNQVEGETEVCNLLELLAACPQP